MHLEWSMLLQPQTGAGRRLHRSPIVDEAARQAFARRQLRLVSSLPCRQPRVAVPIFVGRYPALCSLGCSERRLRAAALGTCRRLWIFSGAALDLLILSVGAPSRGKDQLRGWS